MQLHFQQLLRGVFALRLDQYLVENGFENSRERAKALIMAGTVYVNGEKQDKAGYNVPKVAMVEVRGKTLAYVSRGGLKLEKALQIFPITPYGKVCMDIGASTGGFTDCMLQNGAEKVYAVDVGYGQLAWALRTNQRVVNMERTNIRHITKDMLNEDIAFFSVDVSFISVKHIFPVIAAVMAKEAEGVVLIKPQFEAGREKVGKKGVVREAITHKEVIETCIKYAKENGLCPFDLSYSPIKGPEGNIEFILAIGNSVKLNTITEEKVDATVFAAHESLKS